MVMTIRAAVLSNYVDLAREIGLDPLRLLDRVGIPRAALSSPDLRISAAAVRDLYEICGQTAEDWCLRLMLRRSLSVLGPVMLVTREQATVREALAAINRYNALHHDATNTVLDEVDDLAIVRLFFEYETPGSHRQVAEGSLLQTVRLLRMFLGPDWKPLGVQFAHAAPKVLDTHRRVFGCPLSFDQDFHAVIFPRAQLDVANAAADPEMVRLVGAYAAAIARPVETDLGMQVRRTIEDLLRVGRCSASTVAQQMQLDPRTLQRRLAREDSSYQDELQKVRQHLADHYLEHTDRPLVEVAELLGFSALSAFSRWHRTACGQSPSERRDAARAGAAA